MLGKGKVQNYEHCDAWEVINYLLVTSGIGRVMISGGQNSMTVSSYITTVVCIDRNQQTI